MGEEIEDEEDPDGPHRFSFNVSIDGTFFRRTCPSCGRDFKTEVDPSDTQWIVAPELKRLGVDIGQKLFSKQNAENSFLFCPYCAYKAEASDTLTEETSAYLKRMVQREFVIPMLRKQLSQFGDIGRQTGGFISMQFSYDPSTLPPRPIHGPEPHDMRVVEFLCCDQRIKISDGWANVTLCTYCGESVMIL